MIYVNYEKLSQAAKSIVIVDHHETPYNDAISELENTHFDLTKSGAYLMYEFFANGIDFKHIVKPFIGYVPVAKEVPMIIEYISDRDLYTFNHGVKTKACHLMLSDQTANDPYVVLRHILHPEDLEVNISPYIDRVLAYEAKCKLTATSAVPYTIKGMRFHGLNITSTISDVLNVVSKEHNTPSVGFIIQNDSIQFSLRNGSDVDIDLSVLAQQFGGGGHRSASGFTIKFTDIDMLDFMYNHNIR